MAETFQLVDVFAGPGGLAEGFSAFRDTNGHQPFNPVLSVEKEASAHRTLRLRTFLRQFDGELPPEYYALLRGESSEPAWDELYPEEWGNAVEEAVQAELGTAEGNSRIAERLKAIRSRPDDTILIGGPPCQAYSIVGRARNQGKTDYIPELDHRHYLYEEYIRIIDQLRPAAFVMENVKGMLSSSLSGKRIFDTVLEDLRAAAGNDSYRLFAIGRDPYGRMLLQRPDAREDYILLCERFGVPQARHRVIIVGLRSDKAGPSETAGGAVAPVGASTVRHVLAGLPRLRSGLTRGDGPTEWKAAVLRQMDRACRALNGSEEGEAYPRVISSAEAARERFLLSNADLPRSDASTSVFSDQCPEALSRWLHDPLQQGTVNHATRSHMEEDFARYFYCAVFAEAMGRSPKSSEFPPDLAPSHANWGTGAFADRFRVQTWDAPATTITSHIAKDGHYFIHPDPLQCRALTVREAARVQTFPDNYLFLGNRTEQYIQVGNAVPPFLARQIAGALWAVLSQGEPSETSSGSGELVEA